jgi:hypothetical protein
MKGSEMEQFITAADIEQARAEYEQARKEEAELIASEQRAYDLLERAKARVRRNSEGMGG